LCEEEKWKLKKLKLAQFAQHIKGRCILKKHKSHFKRSYFPCFPVFFN